MTLVPKPRRLTPMGPAPRAVADRFWPKVDRSAGPSACWPWTGTRNQDGYGRFTVGSVVDGSRRQLPAAATAYMLTHPNESLEDLHVLHHCDNPPCCNPSHLFLGTQQDNMTDMARKGRAYGHCGEEAPNAVLTDSLVLKIRATYAAGGLSQRAVGRALGLNPNTVKQVLQGRRWKHVPYLDGVQHEALP